MPAVLMFLLGALIAVFGAVLGWCPVGRGMFVAGLFVAAVGVDLATPDR